MPNGTPLESLVGVLATSINELNRGKFGQFASRYQNYIFASEVFNEEQVVWSGGAQYEFSDLNAFSGNVRQTKPWDQRTPTQQDNLVKGMVPIRFTEMAYGVEERELFGNFDQAKVLDLMKTRRVSAESALVEFREAQLTGKPVNSADTDNVWGLQYWIVPNASTGFNGGLPAGFTDVAGINLDQNPGFKNYTAQYTSVSYPDFFAKARRLMADVAWMDPYPGADGFKRGDRTPKIYVQESLKEQVEQAARANNDNLGPDVLAYSVPGAVPFMGRPMIPVRSFDSRVDGPAYFIDWTQFSVVIGQGWLNRSFPNVPVLDNPYAKFLFEISGYNLFTNNRRAHGVMTTA